MAVMEKAERERRFGGLNRLFGAHSVDALQQAHVLIAGIGGVGSWCVETLVRSGVGTVTLVDMDHVSTSNINRQLPALNSTLGRSKIEVMAERIKDINTACQVHLIDDFVDRDNIDVFFQKDSNILIDCTDTLSAKVAMVSAAQKFSNKKLFVCGAAGGKRNPLALREGDLAFATHDALLGRLRQELRKNHGWPAGHAGKANKPPKMNVHCFWFAEPTLLPEQWAQDDPLQGLSCAGYGSAMSMTASMGLLAAQRAIDCILANET